jgi:hypothetical protein
MSFGDHSTFSIVLLILMVSDAMILLVFLGRYAE